MQKVNGETPKDRARYILSIFLVLFANFILLPCAFFLVVLTVIAIYDKSFLFALVCIFMAVFCVILNRVIIKSDDRFEAKRKEEIEKNKFTEIIADGGRIGRLKFLYNYEEETLTLSGKYLRTFNNDSAFDVISYDNPGKLNFEVEIITDIYKDEDMLVRNMRRTLINYYKDEGVTVSENDVFRIKYKELIISRDKDGFEILLEAEHEGKNMNVTLTAQKTLGADNYEFAASKSI
jgi:hypothetical protein